MFIFAAIERLLFSLVGLCFPEDRGVAGSGDVVSVSELYGEICQWM